MSTTINVNSTLSYTSLLLLEKLIILQSYNSKNKPKWQKENYKEMKGSITHRNKQNLNKAYIFVKPHLTKYTVLHQQYKKFLISDLNIYFSNSSFDLIILLKKQKTKKERIF